MEGPRRITKIFYLLLPSAAFGEGGFYWFNESIYCLNESRRGYRGATILTTIILSTIYKKEQYKARHCRLELQQTLRSEQSMVQ